MFMHGDPRPHWTQFQFGFFNNILKSISLERLEPMGFMHLSTPRLVAVKNPCQDDVYKFLSGRVMD